MELRRLYQTLRLWTIPSDSKRAEWAKKKNIYAGMGRNVRIMDRRIPLYAKLIKFHNNIQVASNVFFITHDAIHSVFRNSGGGRYQEKIGCIEIMDNVFIGSGTTILGNVRIGSNVIVAVGSLVNRDLPDGSVAGGVPAKVIGSFGDLLKKRAENTYPDEIRLAGQTVSDKLMEFMWNRFENERKQ